MEKARVTLILSIAALLTLLLAPAAYSFERVPTFTISELDVGMRGIGKTVIVGTKIEDFNFEIVGILKKGGFNGGSLILCRVWGPVIDKSGGIAGGYSGSPMYIDGKLIGALSAGWPWSEGDIAGVTPIHEMLKTLNYPDAPGMGWEDSLGFSNESKLPKPIVHRGKKYDKVLLLGSDKGISVDDVNDSTLVLAAAKTPLVVGGVSDGLFPIIKNNLESKMPYFDVLQGPGSGPVPLNFSGPIPEPGAAVGVQLMTGDFDLTAIGTLTYVDEYNRILAFGHPFLQSGYIEMPLVSAEIMYTLPNLQRSFKMGEALELIGMIQQDRSTCVAGMLGKEPDLLDINVTVYDEDLDWKDNFHCSIIRHEETMASYWIIAPLQGMAQTLDRSGGGMIEVSFSVDVEGFEEPIEMENVFQGDGFFGQYMAVSELMMVMNALTIQNVYEDIRIESIDIEISVREGNESLNIVKAKSIMPEWMAEDAESEDDEASDGPEDPEAEGGSEPDEMFEPTLLIGENRGVEFRLRNVPQPGLLNLAMTPFGREIIRLNAGEEVLEAVEEYMESTEDEQDDFYEVPKYYPGDIVEAVVTLRPYRQDPIEQYIELQIPEDYPTGTYDVSITGGSGFFGGFFDPFFFGMGYGGYFSTPESLQEVIDSLVDREPNNTLVMSLSPLYSDDPYEYLKDDSEDDEPIQNVIEMGNVVFGYFYLPIEIIDEDSEEDDYTDEYLDDELYAEMEAELEAGMPIR